MNLGIILTIQMEIFMDCIAIDSETRTLLQQAYQKREIWL